ncbi:Cullin-4B [Multifurca ochricompacta]|uniref:Cullin-4B n=1 Tax=Multifurca ochricompacta TaxID=376703 RepID=A0AAD4QIC1_9AGAM|nr:Cullin-4B [Multifurca ochricompacta]
MTDLMALLTFPSKSYGFTVLCPTLHDSHTTLPSPPPRKVARLDADSDSGLSSRSRAGSNLASRAIASRGPIQVRIDGRLPPPITQRQIDECVALLRRCMRTILTRDTTGPLPLTYERIFSLCRDSVVVHNKGETLAGILKIELDQSVVRLEHEIADDISEGVGFASPLVQALTWFENQIGLLEDVMTYLDRGYLIQTKEAKGIRQHGNSLLLSHVFYDPRLHERLAEVVNEWLTWEWQHEAEHPARLYIRTLISHLRTHAQYNAHFESQYVRRLSEYYTDQAKRISQLPNDPLVFLEYCSTKTDEEAARARAILPDTSWDAVQATTERSLLLDQLDWLANGVIGQLIKRNDAERLKTLIALFDRVAGLPNLVNAFKSFVTVEVSDIVCDVAKDEAMVERLLAFKSNASLALSFSILSSSLAKDFQYALHDAFADGFKRRHNKPAEMTARHIDKLMRKGQGSASDDSFNEELDAALALYRFTADKDVFRAFYHRALAKRLLLGRSASDDAEKAMLKKLKEEYDPEFGMGDHMFRDLALSRDTMTEYHKRIGPDRAAEQKLTTMVLQQSFWPFSSRAAQDAIIPSPMQRELDSFSAFYNEKHQGHKVEWNHALGTVSLRARFAAGQKELSVSLYQAAVLLLFNDISEIPFADVKLHTGIEDAELRRTLQSLACGKKKVLKKRPAGKDVNEEDIFVFNDAFEDPRAKVHINSIQVKETPEESKNTQSAVEGDRKHYLDAAIVRVMKARKQLTYEQIKTETIEAVRRHFIPDVTSIKQRIDGLVEQEYLRRDDEDRNLFFYVA